MICSASYIPRSPNRRKNAGVVIKNPEFDLYRRKCQFRFSSDLYQLIINYSLFLEHGGYHKETNQNGAARDHMFSIWEGFQQGIDPSIISHPANCQFLLHKDNASKGKSCAVTIEELMARIEKWREDA